VLECPAVAYALRCIMDGWGIAWPSRALPALPTLLGGGKVMDALLFPAVATHCVDEAQICLWL
jgi:hypothetical protein